MKCLFLVLKVWNNQDMIIQEQQLNLPSAYQRIPDVQVSIKKEEGYVLIEES